MGAITSCDRKKEMEIFGGAIRCMERRLVALPFCIARTPMATASVDMHARARPGTSAGFLFGLRLQQQRMMTTTLFPLALRREDGCDDNGRLRRMSVSQPLSMTQHGRHFSSAGAAPVPTELRRTSREQMQGLYGLRPLRKTAARQRLSAAIFRTPVYIADPDLAGAFFRPLHAVIVRYLSHRLHAITDAAALFR